MEVPQIMNNEEISARVNKINIALSFAEPGKVSGFDQLKLFAAERKIEEPEKAIKNAILAHASDPTSLVDITSQHTNADLVKELKDYTSFKANTFTFGLPVRLPTDKGLTTNRGQRGGGDSKGSFLYSV